MMREMTDQIEETQDEDIRAILEEMHKIGCINCQWYNDGECLYYDRKVGADYFCRMWG